MKTKIREIVLGAAQKAFEDGLLPSDQVPVMEIETPKHDGQGDFSSNFAMVSAKNQKMAPRKIAEAIVNSISLGSETGPGSIVEKVEIAGPGFIKHGILWLTRFSPRI